MIVTHNKKTMESASCLYGVTMQEQGISKIVSVKFHKAGAQVTDHRAASLETPVAGRQVEEEEDSPHKKDETLEVVMAK